MRYTPTLRLSTRLTVFVTVIVSSTIFVLFIGGTFSFRYVGKKYLNQHIEGIVSVIDKEVMDGQNTQDIKLWMPKLLLASRVVELELSSSEGVVYYFLNDSVQIDESHLYEKHYQLEKNADYSVLVKTLPFYLEQNYFVSALSSIFFALSFIIFCLLKGVNWLKRQLEGVELLEERGRMILTGKMSQYAKGQSQEWPYTASDALDALIDELQDARQERSRFDSFIRTYTFLDQLTGAGNRLLFDSKLESALQENASTGGIVLCRIYDWENVTERIDKSECDKFIVEVGNVISNSIRRFSEVIFSRYYESDFAVLVPHKDRKEIAVLVNQCVRQLDKITPLNSMNKDNWFHIGVTMYSEGESREDILSEVDTAVKSAQLQNSNNWSRFSKKEVNGYSRGTVKWRTLFDKSLKNDQILIFDQPCYLYDRATSDTTLLHNELLARIVDVDNGGGIIKASRFIPALEQVGYQSHMDRWIVCAVLKYLKLQKQEACYSINLHVASFKDRAYVNWLKYELLQLTREMRSQLNFEFVEGQLVKHLDYMRPVVRMLSGLGCEVVVDQVGRTIISTYYIKDLSIRYLKLHRSLISKIEQKQENQLLIRSLIGACQGTGAHVIAVGVERGKEWNTLLDLGVHGGQGRMFQAESQIIPKPTTKAQIGSRNRWRKKL